MDCQRVARQSTAQPEACFPAPPRSTPVPSCAGTPVCVRLSVRLQVVRLSPFPPPTSFVPSFLPCPSTTYPDSPRPPPPPPSKHPRHVSDAGAKATVSALAGVGRHVSGAKATVSVMPGVGALGRTSEGCTEATVRSRNGCSDSVSLVREACIQLRIAPEDCQVVVVSDQHVGTVGWTHFCADSVSQLLSGGGVGGVALLSVGDTWARAPAAGEAVLTVQYNGGMVNTAVHVWGHCVQYSRRDVIANGPPSDTIPAVAEAAAESLRSVDPSVAVRAVTCVIVGGDYEGDEWMGEGFLDAITAAISISSSHRTCSRGTIGDTSRWGTLQEAMRLGMTGCRMSWLTKAGHHRLSQRQWIRLFVV
eukprot:Hpha_TRINITY_DN16122_c1_g1::TRINITY_DN16122_c1_g1_i3::g.7279::m.7279